MVAFGAEEARRSVILIAFLADLDSNIVELSLDWHAVDIKSD